MVKFLCTRCGWSSDRRADFRRHLMRKIVCLPTMSNDDIKSIYDMYFEVKTLKDALDAQTEYKMNPN